MWKLVFVFLFFLVCESHFHLTDVLFSNTELDFTSVWFILFVVSIVAFFWPSIQRQLDRWYDHYEARKYAAKYHKNPDLALERLEAIQLARQRMQEELDRKAKEYEEKRKEREEQKAREKIALANEKEKGHRLGYSSSGQSSRSEYNPLMGDTSHGYRPPRRSACPGGGCG